MRFKLLMLVVMWVGAHCGVSEEAKNDIDKEN